ncbi:MAG: recombinase family protein, partial [Candidatus Omnitrophica bacterium]|nr:recombinase family protein [Candidatus Omnitrophota bacterium]
RGFLNLLGVFAEMEREMTSERVSESMKVLTKKGKWLGGVLPYGYTSKNKQLIINNQEALIVKKIFNKYLELESLRGVTSWLNSNGIKTRNKKTWACASISRILQNPTYIGKLSWGKRVASTTTGKLKSRPKEEWLISEGKHKGIIDNFTFKKVQEIVKKQSVEPRRKLSEYLLSSLVRCGFCNGSMNGYSQKKDNQIYSYYKCHNSMSKGKSVCKGNALNKTLLEKIVIDKILSSVDKSKIDIKKALDIYNREVKDKINPLKSEKETLEKRNEGIDLKKKTLLEKLEDRIIDNQTYKNRVSELEEELAKNRERIFKIDVELNDKNVESISFELVYEKIRDFKKAWHTLDYTAQKDLLYTLISKIIVKDEQIDISLFFLPSLFSSNLEYHTGRGSLQPLT